MLNKFILTTTAAILISGSAMAADAVIYNEPPLADINTFTWTGAYIGLNAGYGFGRVRSDFADDIKPKGFVGGIQAGYNWQFDQFIVGVETDFQGSAMKEDTTFDFIDEDNKPDEFDLKTKIQWFGTVRGRLGAYIAERTMLYGTAGLAYGKVKLSNDAIEASKTRAGYAVGAGLEYAFTDNVTLKGEYLYTDLGRVDFSRRLGDETSFKTNFSTVRIGVNYKF